MILRINGEDGFDFEIYSEDDNESIKIRLASVFKTLPKYLKFYDEIPQNFDSNDKYDIIVENFLDTIITYASGDIYDDENEEENVVDILDSEHLDSFYSEHKDKIEELNLNIKNDVLNPYILFYCKNNENFNIPDIDDKFVRDTSIFTYTEKLIMTFQDSKFFEEYKDDEDLKNIITKYEKEYNKLKEKIKSNKEKAEEKLVFLQKMNAQEYEKLEFTEFETENMNINFQLNYDNISLLELFNYIQLNDKIPFAKCQTFYKIYNNFIPQLDWISFSDDFIYLKLTTKKKNEYIDIIVNTDYILSFTFSIHDFSEEEIIQEIKNVFTIDLDIKNKQSTDINGVFYIPKLGDLEKTYNKYIFSDMVMNDNVFKENITIDEAKKTTKKQFYLKYKDKFTFLITFKEIMKNDELLNKYESFTIGSKYLRIKIIKCFDKEEIEKFQHLISKLFSIYNSEYKNILKFYKKYLSSEEIKELLEQDDEEFEEQIDETNIQKKTTTRAKKTARLKDLYPDIFVNNYSRYIGKKPTVVQNEEQLNEAIKLNRQIMTFPVYKYETTDKIFPQKYIDNPIKLACFHDEYIYPGLKENNENLSNFKTFPLLPACYKKNQLLKDAKTDFTQYFSIEENIEENIEDSGKKDKSKQIIFIKTNKILDENFIGVLPPSVSKFFELSKNNPEHIYYRKGVERNKNSFLSCIIDALGLEIDIEDARIETVNKAILSKQEFYNKNVEEIQNCLQDEDFYFDPSLFIRIIEHIYECNVFIFKKDKTNESLVLPYHSQKYYKFLQKRKCILIYEHYGTEIDAAKYPQCELIFRSNVNDRYDNEYLFDYDSEIIQKLLYVYNKLDNIVYYDNKLFNNDLNQFIDHKIVSQVIDEYGKTRILNIKLPNFDNISIFTEPLPPLYVSEDTIENITYASPENVEYIISSLNITNVSNKNNIVYGKIQDLNIFFYIYDENKIIYDNVIINYNKLKRLSRYTVEYVFWLYSKYIHEENLNISYDYLKSFENIKDFISKHFIIKKNHEYKELVPNKFSLNDSSIIYNGKIVVKSNECLTRLIYVLKLKIIREYNDLLNYYTKKSIYNYYLDINDFDTFHTQIILKGTDFTKKYIKNMREKDLKYKIYNTIIPPVEIENDLNVRYKAYFFQNDNIGNDVYIAQTSDTLEKAIQLALLWNTEHYNKGYNIEIDSSKINILKKSYDFTFFSYKNSSQIERFKIDNKNDRYENNIKIIGYLAKGIGGVKHTYYTSLLKFDNKITQKQKYDIIYEEQSESEEENEELNLNEIKNIFAMEMNKFKSYSNLKKKLGSNALDFLLKKANISTENYRKNKSEIKNIINELLTKMKEKKETSQKSEEKRIKRKIKKTLSDGDCFFSALFRSLVSKQLYNKFISCMKNSKYSNLFENIDELDEINEKNKNYFNTDDESSDNEQTFIISMRNFISETDHIENVINNYLEILLDKEESPKSIQIRSEDDSDYIQKILMKYFTHYNYDYEKIIQFKDKIIQKSKKEIRRQGSYIGGSDYFHIKDIIPELCGISLISVKNDLNIEKFNNENTIFLYNIDSNHYKYIDI